VLRGCARPVAPEEGCGDCAAAPLLFDAAFVPYVYEGAVRRILHAYKFEGRARLAGFLAAGLVSALPPGRRFDAVVAVPLDPAKRRKRGFNQSALLARRLSLALGVRDLSEGLRRTASPSAQSALPRSERFRNVEGRFRARGAFEGLEILLVDDVLTTGLTASECARELKRAGATSVAVAACARALA